ncbi:MAG: sulfotransferase family protein [Ilyomonas sp.]
MQLMQRAIASGNISAKGYLRLVVYILKSILVIPGSVLQFLFYSRRIKRTTITKAPIFILGYYRSGTTLLHKLIASDKQFGFVTYYDIICPNTALLFGKPLKKILQFFVKSFKIKTPFFNDTIPIMDEPAEEERFLINKASAYTDYWRFMFPLNWNRWKSVSEQLKDDKFREHWQKEYLSLLKMITYKNSNKQLVLKSPPNTELIKYLLKVFPQAKFIYIHRNPCHLFYSMKNLWCKAIKKYCVHDISNEQVEEIIFNDYIQLTSQYEKDKCLIPVDHLIEIKYEELEKQPLSILKKIYKELNIPGFENAAGYFEKQIEKEKKYQKFQYKFDEDVLKKIERRWISNSLKENHKVNMKMNCSCMQ